MLIINIRVSYVFKYQNNTFLKCYSIIIEVFIYGGSGVTKLAPYIYMLVKFIHPFDCYGNFIL